MSTSACHPCRSIFVPIADVFLKGPTTRFPSNWPEKRGNNRGTSKFLALSFLNFAFLGALSNSLKIQFLRSFDPHCSYKHFMLCS